jgi:hypothetical protein
MTGKLDQTKDKQLMDTIHWGHKVDKENAVKLRDFIEDKRNEHRCLQVGNFMFLFFDNVDDYEVRFGEDTTISVLGSRPGMYIYQCENRKNGAKVGESERLHERMETHCKEFSNKSKDERNPDYIGDNPGVVILKCTGTRSSDEFNVNEMRKLGEILVNDFLKKAEVKFDIIRRPRVYVSEEGCEQAKDLIKTLKTAVHDSRFENIVGSAKTVNLVDLFNGRGV